MILSPPIQNRRTNSGVPLRLGLKTPALEERSVRAAAVARQTRQSCCRWTLLSIILRSDIRMNLQERLCRMRLPGNGISRQRPRHRNTLTNPIAALQRRCVHEKRRRIGPIWEFSASATCRRCNLSPSVCLRRSSFPRDGITSQRQGLASLTCRQLHWNRVQHFFEHYKDLEPGKWAKTIGWGDSTEARQSYR